MKINKATFKCEHCERVMEIRGKECLREVQGIPCPFCSLPDGELKLAVERSTSTPDLIGVVTGKRINWILQKPPSPYEVQVTPSNETPSEAV